MFGVPVSSSDHQKLPLDKCRGFGLRRPHTVVQMGEQCVRTVLTQNRQTLALECFSGRRKDFLTGRELGPFKLEDFCDFLLNLGRYLKAGRNSDEMRSNLSNFEKDTVFGHFGI